MRALFAIASISLSVMACGPSSAVLQGTSDYTLARSPSHAFTGAEPLSATLCWRQRRPPHFVMALGDSCVLRAHWGAAGRYTAGGSGTADPDQTCTLDLAGNKTTFTVEDATIQDVADAYSGHVAGHTEEGTYVSLRISASSTGRARVAACDAMFSQFDTQ